MCLDVTPSQEATDRVDSDLSTDHGHKVRSDAVRMKRQFQDPEKRDHVLETPIAISKPERLTD